MNGLTAINKITSASGISGRSLRYWESMGLFTSTRDADSGWRLYDEEAVRAIKITSLLRGLDIGLSDIKTIISEGTADGICKVLEKQINNLNKSGDEIKKRRQAITALINLLKTEEYFSLEMLENALIPAELERNKANITKIRKGVNMDNNNLHDEVDFVLLPPMRTAAFSVVDVEPEDKAVDPVLKWIKANNLESTMRLYGFNTEPYPSASSPAYGFGYCASIPEGIEIPEPLYEMSLPGGIYAVIRKYKGDPSFGWKKVHALMADETWEWEYDNSRIGLEDHIQRGDRNGVMIHIYFPVKRKVK